MLPPKLIMSPVDFSEHSEDALKTAIDLASCFGAELCVADLIVIATHGMTGWHKLAFGSVTDKVVRLATCPVLVLRAQAETESHETAKNESVASSH